VTVQFGIFDHLDHDGLPLAESYEKRLLLTEAYDRLGFRGYHVAEHHSTPLGLAPSPSVYLSSVAQRTRTLRFGPLVYLLPYYHPIRLIEEICMLDQLSGGRLEFGLGRGVSPVEAALYGHGPENAEGMFQEALQIIRMGLAGEPLEFDGEFYHFHDVPLHVQPFQKPHPPLWYGVHTEATAERVARLGYNTVVADPIVLARRLARRFREVWDSTHGAGRPEPLIGLNRFIIVAPTDAQAQASAERAYPVWFESFNWLYRRSGRAPVFGERPNTFASAVADTRGIAGSPATVAAALTEQLAGSDFNYLLCQFAFGDLSLEESRQSAELFTHLVAPVLRGTAAVS
jgi:alkanesulfonate monooxygenase SsuD/methylene tetrahydromethanopterin reductase-like flavin-dependent oxidoreductase (luciferase family)